ncbi:MAG: hypothetical protein V1494_05475 [Candidatus Diapherotrites archaeon]
MAGENLAVKEAEEEFNWDEILPKPSEELRMKLLKEELKLRKKQPQHWAKTKYRKYAKQMKKEDIIAEAQGKPAKKAKRKKKKLKKVKKKKAKKIAKKTKAKRGKAKKSRAKKRKKKKR